jgi:hypothetical protein
LKDFVSDIGSRNGKLLSILGPAGLMLGGGYALLGGDDSAYASGPGAEKSVARQKLENALNTGSYFVPGIGQGRMAYDLGIAGGDIARSILDAPPSSVIDRPVSRTPAFPPRAPLPGSGEYPEPPMPSDVNLAAARREDARQREELRLRGRAHVGSEAANAVPARGYTGNEDFGPQSDESGLARVSETPALDSVIADLHDAVRRARAYKPTPQAER